VAMFVVGTIFHYPEYALLPDISPSLGLTRHAIERIMFALPMTYAGFVFGKWAGLGTAFVALAIMLPRAILISETPRDAVIETCAVVIVGGLVNLWFEGYRRERRRAEEALLRLAEAQKELRAYVQVVETNARRLSALNEVSDVMSHSLELEDVLNAAATKVAEVMDVDVVLAFLLDEDTQNLEPRVHYGVSDEFIAGIRKLKMGEGLNGQVAQTGEVMVVDDASTDPRVTRGAVLREGIRGQVIAPLRVEGKVTGTLCVARRGTRRFAQEDVDLLSHIAGHIGVAVDNARLYRSQRVLAERIARDAKTEKEMRESLSYYLQQAIRAQEEERKRVARELHDETAQDLAALSRQLDTLTSTGEGFSSRDTMLLDELRQQVDRALEGVRRFSQDLRPSILDDLGLMPALEWLASDVEQHFGIAIEVEATPSLPRFPPEAELILFRVAQEALRNVWKHAKASRARVALEHADAKTVLVVEDNGTGFELPESMAALANRGKLGLVGMQERVRLLGGTLDVESEPGRGTRVTVALPAQAV